MPDSMRTDEDIGFIADAMDQQYESERHTSSAMASGGEISLGTILAAEMRSHVFRQACDKVEAQVKQDAELAAKHPDQPETSWDLREIDRTQRLIPYNSAGEAFYNLQDYDYTEDECAVRLADALSGLNENDKQEFSQNILNDAGQAVAKFDEKHPSDDPLSKWVDSKATELSDKFVDDIYERFPSDLELAQPRSAEVPAMPPRDKATSSATSSGRCGAKTLTGKRCSKPVAAAGKPCHLHGG